MNGGNMKKSILFLFFVFPFATVFATSVDSVLAFYPALHSSLVGDDLMKAKEAGKAFKTAASAWLETNAGAIEENLVKESQWGADSLSRAGSLDDARINFVQINKGAIGVIRTQDALKAKWQLFYCPMVAQQQGYWVQPKGQELANPFMGSDMPGCGSKKPW